MSMRHPRRAWQVLVAILALLGAPHLLWAHAHLRKSTPSAHDRLDAAPTTIRLWFTEEPELSLTIVRLTDSSGAVVALGAPAAGADGALSVWIPIQGVVHDGLYTVAWRTAALDGHPSHGEFSFRVNASAHGVIAPSVVRPPTLGPVAEQTMPRTDLATLRTNEPVLDASALTPAYVVVRALSFVALLALIGAVTFRVAVLSRLQIAEPDARVRLLRRLGSGASIAAVCVLVTAALRLALQNRMMTGNPLMDTAHMRSMAMETHWGAIWRLQFVAGTVALAGALLARQRIATGWALATLGCVGLAVGAALGGHAAASESARTLAVADDALHVIGAAGWLGSLLWLTAIALPVLSQSGGARAQRVAALVIAFSPTALTFAGVVAITGLVSAWLRLGSVPALWMSSYGQVLLLKLALLGGVAATGFYNWRYVQPALGTDVATARLAKSTRLELLVGLFVIIATAVLVAMPTPMLSP